jgi:membrane-associated phospholipid phosphatase
MGRLFANLGRGSLGVFSTHTALPLAIGSTLTMGAAAVDLDIKEDIADPDNSFGKTSSTIGGAVSVVFVGGLFVGGRLGHGRFRNMTYDMLDGAVICGVYTGILKVAVGRERPNGVDNHSFPSGHASNAFTLATIAQRHYGWKLGAPAYVFAAVVGYSRIMQNAHYLSDVVAGATLGYIVGQTVVRVNNKPLAQGTGKPSATWSVSPILARDVHGLGVTILF